MTKEGQLNVCRVGHCPSELMLDRLHLNELEPASRKDVLERVQECAGCRDRVVLRKMGIQAFAHVDVGAIVQRVEARLPANDTSRRPWWAMGTVAVAAAAALLLTPAMDVTDPDLDRIRSKGSDIRVYRERDGAVVEAFSGDVFLADDRVRFAVKADPTTQIMVLGIEGDGTRSVYYPPGGQKSGPAVQDGAVLPGAIRLNDYTGVEWLVLVACPSSFKPADLGDGGFGAPKGCTQSKFEMVKR